MNPRNLHVFPWVLIQCLHSVLGQRILRERRDQSTRGEYAGVNTVYSDCRELFTQAESL